MYRKDDKDITEVYNEVVTQLESPYLSYTVTVEDYQF